MKKQEATEKTPTTDTVQNTEFPALLALVSRLSGALDSAISGKDRSVLVNELTQFSIENLSEPEKTLITEALKRILATLKRD
ncbi:hypothetical protein [Yersinia aldovae]|uniref:hypothetical protein n=1 Tax=Yersinia aldovae TaxID=29483 RepID=UPI001643AAB1|nr:hypothetical protein [Yersinia aldovae]